MSDTGFGMTPAEAHARDPRLLVVAGLVWLDRLRLVVGRRSPHAGHGAGRLELPGGKIERGEAPAVALARELTEEWGPAAARLAVGPVVDVLHHVYPAPGPEVVLVVLHVDARALGSAGDLRPEPGAAALVFAAQDLPLSEFLEADRELVARIKGGAIAAPW
jgi:ADP-ribose pyrophosphatase YjhB (NUDIX family)